MIEENLKNLLAEIPKTNKYGEKITLVGATKTRTVEEINRAILAGLTDIGENRAQEFRDKFDKVLPCNYHFFGRLQKNKVKYLIGKACLIQSVDSVDLAKEISRRSEEKGLITNILLEVNDGEFQKGGFPQADVIKAYEAISKFAGVKIKGLMSVLLNDTEDKILSIGLQMRELYDIMRKSDNDITVLSMGMSQDHKIAIECGSNMVRIGSAIFGKRE
ncbi:MAG: YggS family pyridoxal phosphate-dependent enzyme [Clostridia bacterium]|nr:YggS family pyridoxal phosphate-dependent enzyme [Clostridia bacterium]